MKEVISVNKVNETFLHLDCSGSIAAELSDYFSFFVPGYQWMPKFREKLWDGKIRLLNRNMTLYVGLINHLAKFCRKNDYHLELPKDLFFREDREELAKYPDSLTLCDDYGDEIQSRDYQTQAFVECLERGRRTILSSTNSGKSLMIYMICHYLLHEIQIEKDILIVVPTTTLVKQMTSDFANYAMKDEWNPEDDIHGITAGVKKDAETKYKISLGDGSTITLPGSQSIETLNRGRILIKDLTEDDEIDTDKWPG